MSKRKFKDGTRNNEARRSREASELSDLVMPELNDRQKEAVYRCVREYLWMARVWNDHNFLPEVILEKAKVAADALGCSTVDEANALLDKLQLVLEA